MSTTTATTATVAPTRSLAASAKFKAFCITMGLAAPIVYVACEWFNLPVFTYHPATGRLALGFEAARSGEGPAMYWYGWTVTTLVASGLVGLLGTWLPERVVKKLPLALIWLLPTLAFVPLAYSLMPFWTK